MKKIIISLILFLTPTICFAKTIKIDGTNYNVDDKLELNGLIYDSSNDTLILNNATLTGIYSDNDLKIIVNGENTINNNRSVSSCIKGNHVTIEGNGKLNLISKSKGVSANKLDINNTTIIGDVFTSMFVLTGDNPIMNISNSNIVFKDLESAFYIVNGIVNIVDSNVITEKTINVMSDNTNFININNSTFDVIETNYITSGDGLIKIDSNSKLFIYSLDGLDEKNIDGESIKYLGSNDNSNYHENITNDDKYLKIIPDSNLESELENLKTQKEEIEEELKKIEEKNNELDKLEEQNIKKEQDLIKEEQINKEKEEELNNKQLELLELNDGLNKKEEEIMKKEDIINASLESIDIKESSINALSNILLGKQNEVSNLENSIANEKLEIESLKRYLNLKEKELLDKENKLLIRNEEDNALSIEEEKKYYGSKEVLNDDIMENSFKVGNENVNIINKLGNFIYLFISYISGIVTHIITKRRING